MHINRCPHVQEAIFSVLLHRLDVGHQIVKDGKPLLLFADHMPTECLRRIIHHKQTLFKLKQ
jgi:hypothetical protein